MKDIFVSFEREHYALSVFKWMKNNCENSASVVAYYSGSHYKTSNAANIWLKQVNTHIMKLYELAYLLSQTDHFPKLFILLLSGEKRMNWSIDQGWKKLLNIKSEIIFLWIFQCVDFWEQQY